jgi:hypothetical protein
MQYVIYNKQTKKFVSNIFHDCNWIEDEIYEAKIFLDDEVQDLNLVESFGNEHMELHEFHCSSKPIVSKTENKVQKENLILPCFAKPGGCSCWSNKP